jgi:hypothetical protein
LKLINTIQIGHLVNVLQIDHLVSITQVEHSISITQAGPLLNVVQTEQLGSWAAAQHDSCQSIVEYFSVNELLSIIYHPIRKYRCQPHLMKLERIDR